jgi:hypothetical protein
MDVKEGESEMEVPSSNYQSDTQPAVLDAMPEESEDWPAKIEKVLEKRKPYAAWLSDSKSYLKHLETELEDLERQKNELAGAPIFQPYLEGLPFGELANRAREQQGRLSELGRRFERTTLNIAVVGMVNQGKSFLLRTLSGLPPEIIPNRGNEHDQLAPLTGARSTIINELRSDIRGRVSFYSKSSLLAVLNAYHVELIKMMGQVPDITITAPYSSLEDFRQRELPPEGFAAMQPARYEALLRQLKKYKLLLSHNQSYIGQEPLEGVPVSELAHYVTQGAAGQRSYLYLAVEKVEIWCQFPHKGSGRIALIDMPGLGEVTLGGPERVLEALRLDADIALFVWRVMPNDTLHEGESLVSLYDTCYQAMKHTLPLNEWSFLVLNHDRKRDNLKECEEALEKVREPGSAFKFFAERICDCSSEEEVRKHVLSHVLNHLAERMGDLDRRVAGSCARELEELMREASQVLRKALDAFGSSTGDLDNKEFEALFDKKWSALRRGLNNLVTDLREQSNEPDDSFVRQVKEALDACRRSRIMPDEEDVRKHLQSDSAYDRVMETRRIWMRAEISQSLHALDTALDQPLAAVKARVARVLDVDGGFGRLVDGNNLEHLAEKLAPHGPALRAAFDNLINFHMSARGIIGYKIRVRLQALEPRKSLTEPASEAEKAQVVETAAMPEQTAEGKHKNFRIKSRKETPAENESTREPEGKGDMGVEGDAGRHGLEGSTQIHHMLSSLFESTLAEIAVTLGEDFSRPNQVGYAIVADFVDEVVHDRQSETQWRNVYRNLREFVWPTDYELQKQRQQKSAQWRASLEKVSEALRRHSHALPG